MGESIVIFDRVWKKFRRGERHDSLRDLIPATLGRMSRRRPEQPLGEQEFWALRDVSFEVRRGEALGIIGPNGAGKSTTLKLLTRILKPTRGNCLINGRAGALIEVAAGFHPDLTGRENIYLQGAVMGMRRQQVAERFSQIVDFAGVGAFIDTQVKRYSSGMNARLGFAIAAHLDPDALVIDEVLSVGDMAFQQKCVERMIDYKRQGVAIVFVSHNLQAVGMLCESALYLKGTAQASGATADVVSKYLLDSDSVAPDCGTGDVAATRVELTDDHGKRVSEVVSGDELVLHVLWHARRPLHDFGVGFVVYRSTDGLTVYDANWTGSELGVPAVEQERTFTTSFRFRTNLTRGHYYVASHVYHHPTQTFLGRVRPAAMFSVSENRTYSGIADLGVRVTSESHDN